MLGDPLAPKQTFPGNVVCNQKYTLITFLPIVLYEQFKFFFNLYFLLVALSQVLASPQTCPASMLLQSIAFANFPCRGRFCSLYPH